MKIHDDLLKAAPEYCPACGAKQSRTVNFETPAAFAEKWGFPRDYRVDVFYACDATVCSTTGVRSGERRLYAVDGCRRSVSRALKSYRENQECVA